MIWVRFLIFMMMEAMEDERTASSSRRSAKLRERSRGRVSRVWLYSERTERVYTVLKLLAWDDEAREGAILEMRVQSKVGCGVCRSGQVN